jgi:hypothetical protein
VAVGFALHRGRISILAVADRDETITRCGEKPTVVVGNPDVHAAFSRERRHCEDW